MKNTNEIAFVLGWNKEEKNYSGDVIVEKSSLYYLVKTGKLLARNLEDLPKKMEGEVVIIPEGIIDRQVIVHVFTQTPIPKKWLSSQDLLEANKSLMNTEVLENQEKRNIEFSFIVEEGEEVEFLRENIVVIVF